MARKAKEELVEEIQISEQEEQVSNEQLDIEEEITKETEDLVEEITEEEEKSIFEVLHPINCDPYTKVLKNGNTSLKYLSWSKAWEIVMANYPSADFEVEEFDNIDSKGNVVKRPWIKDEDLGYMVKTKVTINGITRTMQLPVMDSTNKAMKSKPYTYKVKEYKDGKWTGNYNDKMVESATMFDINTAIMRCLAKNLALFGLALHLYNGEDIPQEIVSESVKNKTKATALALIADATTQDELKGIWANYPMLQKDTEFYNAIVERQKILVNN